MDGRSIRFLAGGLAAIVGLVANSVMCPAFDIVPVLAASGAQTPAEPLPPAAPAPLAQPSPGAAGSGSALPAAPADAPKAPGTEPVSPEPSATPGGSGADRVLLPNDVATQVLKNQLAEGPDAQVEPAGRDAGWDGIPRGEEDVPPGLSGRVGKFIRYFQNAGRKRFELYLARSGKYSDLMRGILEKYGLPGDLIYLALIESGFSPNAYSVARAAGPWQFISGTAKRYGLRIDWWADERRDYEKSTHAAASYLKDLYGLFESWDLAAAAYNAGEGKIMNAVTRYKSEEYTDLIRGRYLKQETKDYVPKMYAALSIAKEPERYGFGDVKLEEPLAFDKVEVPGATDLPTLGTIIGLSTDAIREWNPELRRFCTPPNREGYELRLPQGYGPVARDRMEEIRRSAKVTFLLHPVRRGESLESLADRYRVPVETLREMNGLKRNALGRTKQLVIPVAGLSAEEAAPGHEITAEQLEAALARAGEGVRKARLKTRIKVRRGDTLERIASRAGVNADGLARANGLSPGAKLKAGRTLRLPPMESGSGGRPARRVARGNGAPDGIARPAAGAPLSERSVPDPGRPMGKGGVRLAPSES